MIIKGKEYDISKLKDDDVINERWIVVNDAYLDEEEICIRFCYLTDKDLESLRVCNLLSERKPNENAVWVCCEDGKIFVNEFYKYSEDEEDINGYKEFETVEEAMKWCENHTSEEIHKLLSE